MKGRVILLCLVIFASAKAGQHKAQTTRYDGFQVLRVIPNSDDQVKQLMEWQRTNVELDFWSVAGKAGQDADVMMPPHQVDSFIAQAQAAGMTVSVVNNNIQRDIDLEDLRLNLRFAKNGMSYNKNDYNTLDAITGEMFNLARNSCPSGFSCEVYSIGRSFEGRELNVLKIFAPMDIKQSQWIDSTIHAREWLAPATVMNFIDYLMKNYGSDSRATEMLNMHDWYFMPVVNPDGYLYSWTNTRMWRKNRRPFGSCIGVDLNRNFDFRWATGGVSNNPCSEIYCGPSAASEPEVAAVQNELNILGSGLGTNMIGLVTVHTYGNMFMHPWGYKTNGRCTRAADHDKMYRVSEAAGRAIENSYNTRWSYGNSCEVIYETTGSTEDYAKAVSGVVYAFCPELRGGSFIVDRSQIQPSSTEFFNGIYAMVKQIQAEERGA